MGVLLDRKMATDGCAVNVPGVNCGMTLKLMMMLAGLWPSGMEACSQATCSAPLGEPTPTVVASTAEIDACNAWAGGGPSLVTEENERVVASMVSPVPKSPP